MLAVLLEVEVPIFEERLAGEYPSLAKMLSVFAARQIRNRATLGGNLATASPIGDGAPVLLSLDADLVLASAGGERTVPVSDFFTAYRKTLLVPGEVILEIVIPRGAPGAGLKRRSEFFKVSKRRELDISIVAAAFSVEVRRIVPAGFSRNAVTASSSASTSSKRGPIVRSRRSPASVGDTRHVGRVRSRIPSRGSKPRMVWLSADCDTLSASTHFPRHY